MPDNSKGGLAELVLGKDFVSLLNCVFGFYSIYFFLQNRFEAGLVMIVLAFFADILDGEIARSLFEPTEFGKRMDMADLVSFGAAPAMLVILWMGPLAASPFESTMVHAAAACLLSAELLRLARFQTKESEGNYFSGLPGTANGVIYPLIYLINPGLYPVIIITFLISGLMVSSIKLPLKSPWLD